MEKVQIIQGFAGSDYLKMQRGFEDPFVSELQEAKLVGPHKFVKTHQILLHYQNGTIDTIRTNGVIFIQSDKTFKSKDDLIEKYKK